MLYQLSYFRMAGEPASHHTEASSCQYNQSSLLARAGRPCAHDCRHALGHLAFADLVDRARRAVVLENERGRLVVLPTLNGEAGSERDAQQVRLPLTIVGQYHSALGNGGRAVLTAKTSRHQYFDLLPWLEMTGDQQDRRLARSPREHPERRDVGHETVGICRP